MKDHANESRTALQVITHLFHSEPLKAAQLLDVGVDDGDAYVAALQALSVSLLQVIDSLAVTAGIPEASADRLLDTLRYQLAVAKSVEA